VFTNFTFKNTEKKTKISPSSPKTEFGLQNQYGCVIYPSIGRLYIQRKYMHLKSKSKKKLSEPKNRIWAPKCDTSINRKFYICKRVRRQFTAHNSPRTIHRGTIHRQHNSLPAQFAAVQFTAYISLREFLILLD
jgi:hypothetical protein